MDLTAVNFKALNLIRDPMRGLNTNTHRPLNENGTNINDPETMKQLKEKAKEFEAVFLSQMLKPMWDTVDVNESFGGGQGEEVFRSMLFDEYGKQIAGQGGVGIGNAVLQELIAMQAGK